MVEETVIPEWASEEKLRCMYDVSADFPYLEVRITKIAYIEGDDEIPVGSFEIIGVYFDIENDVSAAQFWRQFSPDEDCVSWTAMHLTFDTFEKYRRRGLASAHIRACFERYPEVNMRHVVIAAAVGMGRTFWLRFGFRIAEDQAEAWETLVKSIYKEKTSYELTEEVPIEGERLLEFGTPYCEELGKVALERQGSITLERYL